MIRNFLLDQELDNFFFNETGSKYLRLEGYKVFVATTQLCHYVKSAKDNMEMNRCGCVLIILYKNGCPRRQDGDLRGGP